MESEKGFYVWRRVLQIRGRIIEIGRGQIRLKEGSQCIERGPITLEYDLKKQIRAFMHRKGSNSMERGPIYGYISTKGWGYVFMGIFTIFLVWGGEIRRDLHNRVRN